MRVAFPLRALFISLAFASASFATEIKQAHMQRYDINDFQRLSEFFTGKEHTGNRIILRTTPEKRSGIYLELQLDQKASELPSGSKAILHVILENSRNAQTFTFPIKGESLKTKRILLGITGKQWKDQARCIAWNVELKDASDNTICTKKSFIWELPE